jgi:hypothetical protein
MSTLVPSTKQQQALPYSGMVASDILWPAVSSCNHFLFKTSCWGVGGDEVRRTRMRG